MLRFFVAAALSLTLFACTKAEQANAAPKPAAAAERTLLKEGAPAPEFALQTHTGERLSLKELKGKKALIWFYPKASTSGCTAEGIALTEAYAQLKGHGVEVVGVSFDVPADNKTFAEAHGFPFMLLSDTDKSMGVAWGAAADTSAGYPQRISYLLDEEGKVLKAWGKVNPKTHADEVLAALAALKG